MNLTRISDSLAALRKIPYQIIQFNLLLFAYRYYLFIPCNSVIKIQWIFIPLGLQSFTGSTRINNNKDEMQKKLCTQI